MTLHEPEYYQQAISKLLKLKPLWPEYWDKWNETRLTKKFTESPQQKAYDEDYAKYLDETVPILNKLNEAKKISETIYEANQVVEQVML